MKWTEKEPEISADLKDDLKIPLCQTVRNNIDVCWLSIGSDKDKPLFLGFIINFEQRWINVLPRIKFN